MTKEFNINVSVYSKTAEAKLPSLKKHSLVTDASKSAKEGLVERDTKYSEIEDPDKNTITKENVLRSYFYGKQLVPISKINEEILNFKDEKCLKMLGFANEDKVPRQHFMEGSDIVAPVDSA
jgi:hypothetical protein